MRRFLVLSIALWALAGCTGTQMINQFTTSDGYRQLVDREYDARNGLKLDVYLPPNPSGAPMVVFFYGGRWSGGLRSDYKFVGQALTQQGFIVAVPELRTYPQERFPIIMEDAAHVVAWVRERAGEFGGDPQKLFVMGHQSGAHIAALLAMDATILHSVGLRREQLRGMIGLAGPYDFEITAPDLRDLFGPPDRFYKSQPVNFADGKQPPMLLMHGEADDEVLPKNTRRLAEAIVKGGGRVETVFYPTLNNYWMLASIAAPVRNRSDALVFITDFIRRQSKAVPAHTPGPLSAPTREPALGDVPALQTMPLR